VSRSFTNYLWVPGHCVNRLNVFGEFFRSQTFCKRFYFVYGFLYVKLPAQRAALPGNVLFTLFISCPLTPPQTRLGQAGSNLQSSIIKKSYRSFLKNFSLSFLSVIANITTSVRF
jgi:hypothetical protein